MLLVIRALLLLIYFLLVAFLGTLFCLLRPFNPDNSRLCGRMFSWGGLKLLGISIRIEGQEQLLNMRPSIVIANHQSNLDLFVHGAVIPRRTVSIGKSSLKYIPLFGQVYWLAGNILINRRQRAQSINTMSEIAAALNQRNTSIWVFPEGTRHPEKGLKPFKKGAFHMAVNAQAPIIPICASSYVQHIDLRRWHAGSIVIRILPPIPTSTQPAQALDALIESTHQRMEQTIDQLDQDLESAVSIH